MDENIKSILSYLPEYISDKISFYTQKGNMTEIRLRSGQNAQINCDGKYIEVSKTLLNQKDIEKIFLKMCDYSLPAFEEEIKYGYITLPRGNRVGLGGEFSITEKGEYLLSRATSLNIRIATQKKYPIDNELMNFRKGLLIAGKPHCGKTTLIKNLAYQFKDEAVVICDERKEIFAQEMNCDCISGKSKAKAVQQAVRTLNPDIIICDEIGDYNEANEILSAVNTGVKFICTAHSDNFHELNLRPNIKLLLNANVFDKVAFLSHIEGKFTIREIVDV